MVMEIGDKVFLTENANTILGLEDGIVGTIKDILKLNIDYPILVAFEEYPDGEWFAEYELILIQE